MVKKLYRSEHFSYYFILFYCLIITILSICTADFTELIIGLKKIILESDILITDYMKLAGIGSAFLNSSLVLTSLIFILIKLNVNPNGAILAGLFTTAGFSLFGKNIVNIWPIILGIYLYSKYEKVPFTNYILIVLFGTTLAPTVSIELFPNNLPLFFSLVLTVLLSTFLGFILPAMASYTLKLHQGYSLANVGLAGGLIGTALASIFTALGIEFEKKLLWSTENNNLLLVLLLFLFGSMILLGIISNKNWLKDLKKLYKLSGRLVTDFFTIFGQSVTFINMGILGIFCTLFIILINGDLNGATLSGIFTVVGFGSFGKHIKNIFPIIIGAVLAAIVGIWELNSPSMLLGILFSTTLCPIAGSFGWFCGIIAGFMHICMVMNIGYLHGGMNLYHNGFAAGFVAMILVPIITAIRKEK